MPFPMQRSPTKERRESVDTPKRKNSPVKLEDIYNQNVTIQNQNHTIINDHSEIKSSLKEITNEVASVRNRVSELEQKATESDKKQYEVDLRLNALEQVNLKCCLEIKGLNRSDLQNINDWKQFALAVLRRLGTTCEAREIKKAYKQTIFNRKENSQFELLVVWFESDLDKDRVMNEKIEYEKQQKIKSNIFLNHALTKYNRILLNKARDVKAQTCMPIVTFRNGKVRVKAKKEDKPRIIHSLEDLDELVKKSVQGNMTNQQQPIGQNLQPSTSTQMQQTRTVAINNHQVSSMSSLPPSSVSTLDLKIFQLNVRGLNDMAKFSILKTTLSCMSLPPDVIALTEVKLKKNFPLGSYTISGYEQYAALRDSEHCKGGVLVYVRSSLQHDCVECFSDDFEKIIIDIKTKKQSIFLTCCYRPPLAENFPNFMGNLEADFSRHRGFGMLIGDLNIDWQGVGSDLRKYKDFLVSYGYDVVNTFSTRPISGKVIDHVAVNFHEEISISNFTVVQEKWFSDHCAILSIVHLSAVPKSIKGYITLEKIDYDALEKNFTFTPSSDPNNIEAIASNLVKSTKMSIKSSTHTQVIKLRKLDKIAPPCKP